MLLYACHLRKTATDCDVSIILSHYYVYENDEINHQISFGTIFFKKAILQKFVSDLHFLWPRRESIFGVTTYSISPLIELKQESKIPAGSE